MESNGSPEPVFETDESNTYFLATLPIHENLKGRAQVRGQAAQNDLNEIQTAILKYWIRGQAHETACSMHWALKNAPDILEESLMD
jgi:hypothetical protein